MSDRGEVNALGDKLKALRIDDESAIVISFGFHAPGSDTSTGSVSVTAMKSGEQATYEAVSLYDALYAVRYELDRVIEAKVKAVAKAKGE